MPPRIQRLCAECDEQMQRKAFVEDEGPLVQAKREGAELEDGAAAIAPYVDSLSGRGEPLAPSTRAFMEPRFAADFSAVRVHTDAAADRSAQAIDALAYTAGDHILFRASAKTRAFAASVSPASSRVPTTTKAIRHRGRQRPRARLSASAAHACRTGQRAR